MGFEVDVTEGTPKLLIRWPKRKASKESVDEWIAAAPQRNRIVEETAAFAPLGVPAADSTQPCAMELRIRLAHVARVATVVDEAAEGLAAVTAELDARALEVSEDEFPAILADVGGKLAEIETSAGNELPDLMSRLARAEAKLRAFHLVQGIENQPITQSFLVWSATAIGTTAAEGLLNGLLFKDVLGYFPAVGFASVIGASIAAFGVGAGLGVALLKRKDKNKRLGGGILLAAMTTTASAFLLGMAHYRTALHLNEADAVAAARATFEASPFAPLADFSLLPYIIVNIVGLGLVAWKTVPMFGFLDLKRLQDAYDRAVRKVRERLGRAQAACDATLDRALGACDVIVERAGENARQGKQAEKACKAIIRRAESDRGKLSKSLVACEQLFRETVEACHPAGRHIRRFARPPGGLPSQGLEIDTRLLGLVHALDAQSSTARSAATPVVKDIYALVNAAKSRLQELAVKVEAETRSGTGGVDNVLRFRRKD